MARYLITGAAGFIGSHVASALLTLGHDVTGVDSLNDAYDVRLKERRLLQLVERPGFTFARADVRDEGAIAALFDPPPDAVVNLAARAGVRPSVETPGLYFDANVGGTLALLEQCRRRGVPKLVLASSSSLYGLGNEPPYREDQPTDRPLSPYAASKKAAEALAYSYHHLHGIDVSVLRYFTVYGPAGRPDMSPFRFVQWIREERPLILYGDGSQSRDFTYVDDIAAGTVAALRPVGYGVFNLGSDRPVTVSRMIELLEGLLGKKARIERRPSHAADVDRTWADIGRAREVLGWEPAITLEEGLSRLVAWYEANREWAREIVT